MWVPMHKKTGRKNGDRVKEMNKVKKGMNVRVK